MNFVETPLPLTTLGRLNRHLEYTPPPHRVVGVHDSVFLSGFLSHHLEGRLGTKPHVIVVPDLASAHELIKSLNFFAPWAKANLLPHFDVGVYSNLYPNQRVISSRIRWLFNAIHAVPGQFFIAPVESILQKTIPKEVFLQSLIDLRPGQTLPEDFENQLLSLGYIAAPTIEDVGTFSIRGGIIDIYSPFGDRPARIELFGDTIESIRSFDVSDQLTIDALQFYKILPAREVLYTDDNRQIISAALADSAKGRPVDQDELQEVRRAVAQGLPFHGMDFLLSYFYDRPALVLDYFKTPVDLWFLNHADCQRSADQLFETLKNDIKQSASHVVHFPYDDLYSSLELCESQNKNNAVYCEPIEIHEDSDRTNEICKVASSPISEFIAGIKAIKHDHQQLSAFLKDKLMRWRQQGYRLIFSAHNHNSAERLKIILERAELDVRIENEAFTDWPAIFEQQSKSTHSTHIILRELPVSSRFTEDLIVFIRDEDLLGKKNIKRSSQQQDTTFNKNEALSFGDLQVGDLIVHRLHGIGIYEGLRVMTVNAADAEFLELKYRDGDKLYIPVYRVGQLNKYIGPSTVPIDKLGGPGWAKTQIKVRNQVRDVANSLLQLYAKRSQAKRTPFTGVDKEYAQFENSFPYQETEDQLRAIHDVLNDLTSDRPMDRLVCGDVGFGKTEVALRAAFKVIGDGKQVALIAPTTILAYQHFENFKRRFASWPIEVRCLNRFVSQRDVKKTLSDLKTGKVDIVIGTHRLLSKDVGFANLGLLIIDEEQKFGVIHKEKLRQLRVGVDTLVLSATPIPRSLNMSLMGLRDLSIINTPPEDRLPTRTFVCKYDTETIRKAISSEISRGGQVFFLHNRVQTIDEVAGELREILPDVRLAVAHGQMDEENLENIMLKFFNHELDVLVCTAIIESGMDIPRANTIFIDNAHTFGVSQLYQLRGRVGRSKERAYCYLLLPANKKIDSAAQERVKIIQDNTALGSGLRVAQYDLELRGAGDILGENQSGHINAVGYDLYMELLQEAIQEGRGEAHEDHDLEPEINLRTPALLPDKYIPDIRMRLYYYKLLSNVRSAEDLDKIEDELKDQFGPLPEPVFNLLGLMLIRKLCRDLGVKDISAGTQVISLTFTNKTPLPSTEVIRLASHENKKYSITPDQRLKIRMNDIRWPKVVDELEFLLRLCVR